MRILRRLLALLLLIAVFGVALVLYFIANPNLPKFTPAKQLHYLEQ
jgi:phage shock protein PspC (stress-responsive transcriptional regulator)